MSPDDLPPRPRQPRRDAARGHAARRRRPDGHRPRSLDRLVPGRRRAAGAASAAMARAALGAGGEPLVVLHEQPRRAPGGTPRRPLPLRAAAPIARRARARALRIAARGEPLDGRLGPRRLRGALPARPRRQRVEIYADRPRERVAAARRPASASGCSRRRSTSTSCSARSRRGRPPRTRARGSRWATSTSTSATSRAPRRSTATLGSSSWRRSRARRSSPPAATTITSASTPGRARASRPRRPAPSGLRRWTIVAAERRATSRPPAQRLRDAGAAVREEDGGLVVRDPWEIELLVSASARRDAVGVVLRASARA